MAIVYSYIRFSSKKQELGDSLRRQVASGENWIKRHGHTLADVTLHDLGRSGFHAHHLKSADGRLGAFLRMIEDGRVSKGSILLVENLDRLSREGIDPATDLFKNILKAGVLIAVLKPTERIFDRSALEQPFVLMETIWLFYLAHIESKSKSERVREARESKRKKILEGTSLNFGSKAPSWLDYNKGEFVLNKKAEVIRFIFEQAASGIGQRKLMALVSSKYRPIGYGKHWNTSFIQAILSDRNVLGELQPMTRVEGKSVVNGPVIRGYYPPVISEELWYRAQNAKATNLRAKGPNSKFVNLLTGRVICATDGHPMHIQATKLKNSKQRRLVSYGHLCATKGACPVTVDYYDVESMILKQMQELRVEDLSTKVGVSELTGKEQELSGIENRLRRIETDIANVESNEDYATLKNAAKLLIIQRDSVKTTIEELKAEISVDSHLGSTQDLIKLLASTSGDDLHQIRLRLRSLIADFVNIVYVKPEKHFGRVWAMIQINYKNGMVRGFYVGPGFNDLTDYVPPKLPPEYAKRFHFGFDLADLNKCQKEHLREMAEGFTEPAKMPTFSKVPASLREASELFVNIRRAELTSESFRSVPSKVRRFVEFVGEMPTVSLSATHWKLFVQHLEGEVKLGRLQKNTARVVHNRARELLVWLFERKAIKAFDVSTSAARAIG